MRRHPDWLKVKIGSGENYVRMKSLLRNAKLHTICEEAKCPNIAECFGSRTAVFLILGDICTRNCKYCNVKHGKPLSLNPNEHLCSSSGKNGMHMKDSTGAPVLSSGAPL